MICLPKRVKKQTKRIRPFVFWEKLADNILLSRLTDLWKKYILGENLFICLFFVSSKSFLCWCFTVNYQFRTRSVLFTEIRPQWQFQFHVTFHCHWCAVSFWTYVLPNWSYSPQLNCLLQRCQYLNLHFQRPKVARYVIFFTLTKNSFKGNSTINLTFFDGWKAESFSIFTKPFKRFAKVCSFLVSYFIHMRLNGNESIYLYKNEKNK